MAFYVLITVKLYMYSLKFNCLLLLAIWYLLQRKQQYGFYHHTIKKKGNQKLYLTDASFLILWSIRHKNSTLKASQYFIDYERQIPVEMVISIQCGWLNVDFTFDTEEIPTSSPCDFFDVVLMSNQL